MKPPRADQPFVLGVVETPVGPVPRVGHEPTAADRAGAWRVRWGIGRDDYRIDPGLYALGDPDDASPVLVTANYKLTFDVLRSSVGALDAWLLVLDTRGINVWCAAGKGTFSTEELIGRIRFCRLPELLSHHKLVVPQLGATGVAAHEVRREARFAVLYGPVRAADIPAYLEAGMKATPEMREPTFRLRERLVLTPVELVQLWKPALGVLAAAVAFALLAARPLTAPGVVLAALRVAAPFLLGALAGAVVTPALLPVVPFRMFAAKGALVGALLGALLAATAHTVLGAAASLLVTAVVSSFVAMNFTGSTPFTSLSGVQAEMRRWLPLQMAGAAAGVLALLIGGFVR